MVKVRDTRLDSIKYFLICLVVIAHFSQGGRYENVYMQSLYSIIYNFHMPLFVMISGYLFHYTTVEQINKSNLRIVEPLLIYHLLFCITHPLRAIHFEPSPLWFLLSLMCWRYLYYYIKIFVTKYISGRYKTGGVKRVILLFQ